jgi:hypothetical protein
MVHPKSGEPGLASDQFHVAILPAMKVEGFSGSLRRGAGRVAIGDNSATLCSPAGAILGWVLLSDCKHYG